MSIQTPDPAKKFTIYVTVPVEYPVKVVAHSREDADRIALDIMTATASGITTDLIGLPEQSNVNDDASVTDCAEHGNATEKEQQEFNVLIDELRDED